MEYKNFIQFDRVALAQDQVGAGHLVAARTYTHGEHAPDHPVTSPLDDAAPAQDRAL